MLQLLHSILGSTLAIISTCPLLHKGRLSQNSGTPFFSASVSKTDASSDGRTVPQGPELQMFFRAQQPRKVPGKCRTEDCVLSQNHPTLAPPSHTLTVGKPAMLNSLQTALLVSSAQSRTARLSAGLQSEKIKMTPVSKRS